MDILDNAGIPNNLAPGNHDLGSIASTSCCTTRTSRRSRYDLPANPWYGGWLGEESGQVDRLNKDNYELFTAGGIDFLIIHLEVDMPTYAVAWANEIIDRYPEPAGHHQHPRVPEGRWVTGAEPDHTADPTVSPPSRCGTS